MAAQEVIQLILYVVGLAAFCVCGLVTFTYLRRVHHLFKYLALRHPKAWVILGKPHLLWHNTLSTNRLFAAVQDGCKGEEFQDETFTEMLTKTQRSHSASSISFVISLACIVGGAALGQLTPNTVFNRDAQQQALPAVGAR